jgi:hypothetical protein
MSQANFFARYVKGLGIEGIDLNKTKYNCSVGVTVSGCACQSLCTIFARRGMKNVQA